MWQISPITTQVKMNWFVAQTIGYPCNLRGRMSFPILCYTGVWNLDKKMCSPLHWTTWTLWQTQRLICLHSFPRAQTINWQHAATSCFMDVHMRPFCIHKHAIPFARYYIRKLANIPVQGYIYIHIYLHCVCVLIWAGSFHVWHVLASNSTRYVSDGTLILFFACFGWNMSV